MSGSISSGRWLLLLWTAAVLCGSAVLAASHTQTVAVKVQGMA